MGDLLSSLHVWLPVRLDSSDVNSLSDVRCAVDGYVPVDMSFCNLKWAIESLAELA